ncbi:MAG: VPLPA-CTERM sorting domain-containing protein [Gammaproteobacteria bacterium]|nr:VPLPA-CTERM sorting domain-containing protein [Gammaproteobacteria bacterium]
MKKIALSAAIATAMAASTAGAATLSVDAGSFFTMGGGTAVNAPGFDGQFISGNDGLVLGTTQSASGSHSGVPNGSEVEGIDNAWAFFGNTGLHLSTSNTNVLSASGNTATADFSGWSVSWNGIAVIPMGSGAWNGNAEGVANITCGVDCTAGDTYTLTYSATVPAGDPSNFGNTRYLLNLVGTISGGDITAPAVIPVPAAVWLLGSGLIGLVGVARRKKAAV